jgi:hypothetical protein
MSPISRRREPSRGVSPVVLAAAVALGAALLVPSLSGGAGGPLAAERCVDGAPPAGAAPSR